MQLIKKGGQSSRREKQIDAPNYPKILINGVGVSEIKFIRNQCRRFSSDALLLINHVLGFYEPNLSVNSFLNPKLIVISIFLFAHRFPHLSLFSPLLPLLTPFHLQQTFYRMNFSQNFSQSHISFLAKNLFFFFFHLKDKSTRIKK